MTDEHKTLFRFRANRGAVPPLLRGHYAHLADVRYFGHGADTQTLMKLDACLWVATPTLSISAEKRLEPVAVDVWARHDFLYDTAGKISPGGATDGRLNQAVSEWKTLLRQFFSLIQRDFVAQTENPAFWLAENALAAVWACGASEKQLNERVETAWEHAVIGSRLLAEEVDRYVAE